MTVWILEVGRKYESTDIEGVYADPGAAQGAGNSWAAAHGYMGNFNWKPNTYTTGGRYLHDEEDSLRAYITPWAVE